MEVKTDDATIMDLKSAGKVDNEIYFIYASSGHGKTLATEGIIEELHNLGYLVIILNDVKDEFELGYSMFEPIEPYHLNLLRKLGKEKGKKKVKIYHPLTLNIPKKEFPDCFNFFSFSIKQLTRDELSFITEMGAKSDAVDLVLQGVKNLKKDEGIYDLVYNIESKMKGSTKKYYGKDIAKVEAPFYVEKSTSGTMKTVGEVRQMFEPFERECFLMPESFDLNIDYKKILKDRKSYHTLAFKWVKDEKMRDLATMMMFNGILANRDLCSGPIVFVLLDLPNLVPFVTKRTLSYKPFLGNVFRDKLSTIRSKGRGGCSVVAESQVWTDIDDTVKGYATVNLFGKLGSIKDIDKLTTALKLTGTKYDDFMDVERGEFVNKDRIGDGAFVMIPPSHRHGEEAYNFLRMFEREYPDSMKSFDDILFKTRDEIKRQQDNVKRKYDEKTKKKIDVYKKEFEDKQRKKEVEDKLKDIKDKEMDKKREIKVQVYNAFKEGKGSVSFRQIGKDFGLHHITVKRYVEEIEKETEKT